MSPFQPMETSSLIICQVIFGNILVEVYEALTNVLLRFYSNSCGKNINLYGELWVIILIQFEVISFIYNLTIW